MQDPSTHVSLPPQLPQLPPQPSSPHSLPVQSGVQAGPPSPPEENNW